MRAPLIVALAVMAIVVLPVAVLSWGNIDEIRYKTKGDDGNMWASRLGGGQVVRGDEQPHTITFTFDDGPDHRTTPILLDQLDRYGIKATFFVNGWRFHHRTAGGIENQAVLRDMYRRKHFIGNHTFSHKDITLLDDQSWRSEVLQVEQTIRSIIGSRPYLFRPPFGRMEDKELVRLTKEGYTVVMWNMDSGDWRAKSAFQVFQRTKRVIEENPEGGVLLFHDTNRSSVEAFPLIVEWIEERNERLRAGGKKQLKIVGIESYVRSRQK
jgi:peptidoglycan-N-acetylglucosamine deacetylase